MYNIHLSLHPSPTTWKALHIAVQNIKALDLIKKGDEINFIEIYAK